MENRTRPKNFDACFFGIFDCYRQIYIFRRGNCASGFVPTKLENFAVFLRFPKIPSFKLFGNS